MQPINNRIGYKYIPSILSWIASGGVLNVELIFTLNGTTFPEDLELFVCFENSCSRAAPCLLSNSRIDQVKEVLPNQGLTNVVM